MSESLRYVTDERLRDLAAAELREGRADAQEAARLQSRAALKIRNGKRALRELERRKRGENRV